MTAMLRRLLCGSLLLLVACDGGSLPNAGVSRVPPSSPGASRPVALEAPPAAQESTSAATSGDGLADAELAPFRAELLDVAFEVASAIPVEPHIKDRSRSQYEVVGVALELDQPLRALAYTDRIENWRRGHALADFAYYCVEHGHLDVQTSLDRAEQIALESADWRRDRIRSRVASTYVVMGKPQQASAITMALVEPAETGKVDVAAATVADVANFDAQLDAVDLVLMDFDLLRNALFACAGLFDRFYDDEPRRNRAEAKITTSWNTLPYGVRFDLLTTLAEHALDHEDHGTALRLAGDAADVMNETTWTAEYQVPMLARLASVRARAGDAMVARRDVDAALAVYDTGRETIMGIFRAETLAPVAVALADLGDRDAALALYGRIIEVGADNPNARPRAQDLAGTCLSMARRGIEPDEAMWQRIRVIQAGLGDPW